MGGPFSMQDRITQLEAENTALCARIEALQGLANHPSTQDALDGKMGEYKRGWYAAWKYVQDYDFETGGIPPNKQALGSREGE